MTRLFTTLLAATALAGAAHAMPVYQSIFDMGEGSTAFFCSQCSSNAVIGATFPLATSSPETVESVQFEAPSASDPVLASLFGYHWPVPVTVSLFNDLGGTVGTPVWSETFSTFDGDVQLHNEGGFSTDLITANLSSPISLAAGNYVIFFSNVTSSFMVPGVARGNDPNFVMDRTGAGVGPAEGDTYPTPVALRVPFALCPNTGGCATYTVGGVPEPGTWSMLLVGIAGLGAALRRRYWAMVETVVQLA